MANNCYFEMKIAGEQPAVEEFIRMISYQGEFEKSGLGRVFSFDLTTESFERDPKKPGYIAAYGAGDCAWSLLTALCDSHPRNLLDESKRLGLAIEAYSSEPGLGFQEHILVDRGTYIENESVDYQEYWVEGASIEDKKAYAEELGISLDELMRGMNCNGDYTVGGYDDFGDYQNLFSILERESQEYPCDEREGGSMSGEMSKFDRISAEIEERDNSYPHLHTEQDGVVIPEDGERYVYKCSVVIYGEVTVESDKPLTFGDAFEEATKQVRSADPTGGTYQVELPEIDIEEIVRCVRIPDIGEEVNSNPEKRSFTQKDRTSIDQAIQFIYPYQKDGVIELYADYQNTNEFLLPIAYENQNLPPDELKGTLYEAIDGAWEDAVAYAEDEALEEAGFSPFHEKRDEVMDYLHDVYSFEPPYEHYLNQEMNVNVLLGTEAEANLDFSSIGDMRDYLLEPGALDPEPLDNALMWLVEQQGYTKADFEEAYGVCCEYGFTDCENMYGTFLASAASELQNFPNVMGTVTVLGEMTLNELTRMQTPGAEITMPQEASVGVFNPWLGGGSMMDIKLEKPLVIPSDKRFHIQIEGAQCNAYTMREVYGKLDETWKKPIAITNQQQERATTEKPLEEIVKEAKVKASEKNVGRIETDVSHKPPSLDR